MVAHYRQYNIMCSNLFLPFQRGLYKLLYDYNPLYINSNDRYYVYSMLYHINNKGSVHEIYMP